MGKPAHHPWRALGNQAGRGWPFFKEFLMPLRENELARRGPAGLELRPTPLRVKWEFTDLVTGDGHELRCIFTGSVKTLSDRTERQMLEEILLDGRTSVSAEDVARHFFPALRGAAGRVAQAHTAKEWLETDQPRQEFVEATKKEAVRVAFACGLEVLPPFQADFQSATFERQRVRAMQQALVEKEAADQVEHFQRSAELLKQFQTLRGSAPELSAGRVLQQMNPADQGSLMQALLMAGARQQATATIWAVAGPYLLRVEASIPVDGKAPPKPQLFPLPPTLGPLRSVQTEEVDGQRVLLVGAQHGFLLVREEDLSNAQAYRDPTLQSPLGFNRVVYWPQRKQFCATHSEGGIVTWNADAPDAPSRIVRAAVLGVAPAAMPDVSSYPSSSISIAGGSGSMGPRNLRRFDADSLVFSAGGRLILWDGVFAKTVAEASPAEITTIVPGDRVLWAIHEDGMICELDYKTKQVVSSQRRFGRVRTAALLPWLGSGRILVAGDDGPVQCVGWDDPLITQYCSSYRGLRVITGSAGVVAAVSPDRQRLVLWNTWEGRQPAAELFLGATARHRVGDIAFSPS